MKKIILTILSLILGLSILCGCKASNKNNYEEELPVSSITEESSYVYTKDLKTDLNDTISGDNSSFSINLPKWSDNKLEFSKDNSEYKRYKSIIEVNENNDAIIGVTNYTGEIYFPKKMPRKDDASKAGSIFVYTVMNTLNQYYDGKVSSNYHQVFDCKNGKYKCIITLFCKGITSGYQYIYVKGYIDISKIDNYVSVWCLDITPDHKYDTDIQNLTEESINTLTFTGGD